ncbi:unnamed protein product [Phytophthora fragariaefolia]|uniref:Unnamed protein product n=1 Tax=Phytophthora fragariaefolia TaxID=1490495 RepID=A0A9W6X393_9STRA|nr:unnamed protein product [Phytophthora fragariaefolia]
MQVEALATFQLSQDSGSSLRAGAPVFGTSFVGSPVSTVEDSWSPHSLTPTPSPGRHSHDSEALELTEDLQSPSRSVCSSPDVASPDGAIDRESADGAAKLREQSVKANTWVEEAWPKDVRLIHEQFNPRGWRFPAVSVGIRRGAGCGCETRCTSSTFLNVKESRFCTKHNCMLGGACDNGLTKNSGKQAIVIDALDEDGVLRLINHSCNPAAKFHEVQTGDRLTVVAVTVRLITAGEKVTVTYEQMLLCQVVEKILPLGRNMWEQVALQYNVNRTRSAPVQDFESLPRKFKNLYTSLKVTGHGEVRRRLRPVVWAKELQQKIKAERGALTTHDGRDEGEDDATLVDEVEEVLLADGGHRALTSASSLGPVSGGSNDRDEDDEVVHTEEGSQPSEQPPPSGSAPSAATGTGNSGASDTAESRSSDTAGNQFVSEVILTSIGPGDAKLTALYDLSDSETTNEDDDVNDSVETQAACETLDASHSRRWLRPTAPPSGENAREVDENQSHNVASNRLGGQDLRISRDNVATMNLNPLDENGKRSRADGPVTNTSFTKSKRMRVQKRIDEIQQDIEEAEKKQSLAGADILRMILMFQKDSERRDEL